MHIFKHFPPRWCFFKSNLGENSVSVLLSFKLMSGTFKKYFWMFSSLAYTDEGCNIVILPGGWEWVMSQIKPNYCRMLSLGKNQTFFFSPLFHFLQADGWRDKDVLSHSPLLKVSEDVSGSTQPSVQSGDGFGSFSMPLPQGRGIFAWHTKMISPPDWHKC